MTIQYINRDAPFALDPAIALLGNEKEGAALDGIDLRGYIRDRTTPANFFLGNINDALTYSDPSPKYIWSGGLLVPGTTLRCDHDPATGAALGVRVEGQATNLLPKSNDLSASAVWGVAGGTNLLLDQVEGGADGNASLWRAEKLATGDSLYWGTASYSGAVNHTASIYVKKDNDESRFPEFSLAGYMPAITGGFYQLNTKTGDIVLRSASGEFTSHAAAVDDAGDFWRVMVSLVADGPASQLRLYFRPAGGVVFGQYSTSAVGATCVQFAQIESGPVATSYIDTDASAVTRAADDITLPLTDFPWNDGSGTLTLNGSAVDPILNDSEDALDIAAIVAAAEETHLKSLKWVPA